jgi:hypothetical protein
VVQEGFDDARPDEARRPRDENALVRLDHARDLASVPGRRVIAGTLRV